MYGEAHQDGPLTPYEQLCEISAAIARITACRIRGDHVGLANARRWLAELPDIKAVIRSSIAADPLLAAGLIPMPVGLDNEQTDAARDRARCTVLASLCLSALVFLDDPDSLDPRSAPGHALNASIMAIGSLTGCDP